MKKLDWKWLITLLLLGLILLRQGEEPPAEQVQEEPSFAVVTGSVMVIPEETGPKVVLLD